MKQPANQYSIITSSPVESLDEWWSTPICKPTVGLFSLQMPFVLLFGTVPDCITQFCFISCLVSGVCTVYCKGLFFKPSYHRASNLHLTFSGFSAWHLSGGHYTFAVYLLAPWLVLTVLNIHKRHGWLWFGLWASLVINTGAHYLTLEALAICAVIAVFQTGKQIYRRRLRSAKTLWPLFRPYVYSVFLSSYFVQRA